MEPRIFAILIVTALLVVKTVGTPEITPVFGFKVKPVGSEPEETVKETVSPSYVGVIEKLTSFEIMKGLPE